METVNILIADDHKMIRDGLKAMLEADKSLHVAAEAKTGLEAQELCRSNEIDLVIMDLNMPDPNGIEATRRIKEEFPDIKVLALTMMQEDEHIRRMLEAGASGYIFKNSGSEELMEAIRTVVSGDYYFSEDAKKAIMMDLVESGGKRKPSGVDDVTDREVEVLKLICKEMTNAEIAEELHISVRTVDAHRRNLLQKTGARNTAGLVRYAFEKGLVDQSGPR